MDGEGLRRLFDIAARDQWRVADLPWPSLDAGALPDPFRAAAVELFTQVHHGELTAMRTAARLVDRVHSVDAQTACAAQVADEARHVRFFEHVLDRLGGAGRVRPSVERFMSEVHEAERPETQLLGLLAIETVAHSFFLETARAVERLDSGGALPSTIDAFKQLTTEWLPGLLGRDESRHIAFGMSCLRALVPELSTRQRIELEDRAASFRTQAIAMAIDPDAVVAVGLDGDAMSRACLAELDQRIAAVGIA